MIYKYGFKSSFFEFSLILVVLIRLSRFNSRLSNTNIFFHININRPYWRVKMVGNEVADDSTQHDKANQMDDYQIYTPFRNKDENERNISYCRTLTVHFFFSYIKPDELQINAEYICKNMCL